MNKIIYILGFLLLLSISSVSAQYYNGTNATGWSKLYDDGNIIGAAFEMYNDALAGWVVAILFVVYQFMLFLKTRNLTLAWIMGVIFAGLYVTSLLVEPISVQIIFVILVMELAGILYYVFWK